MTPEELLREYWERKPLYIPGTADKFRQIFSREAFDRAVAQQEAQGIFIRVSFDSEKSSRNAGMHLPIRADQIDSYLAQGASVCADPIERGDPALARYAATIARQLGFTGHFSVKAYLSADGCGFNTHFDQGIATTLQIEGRKRWRYSSGPAVPFPQGNALLDPEGQVRYAGRLASSLEPWEQVEEVDEGSFQEAVLAPGDVLCLPAGTWHQAKAIGGSLALNLSFQPLDFLSFFTAAIRPLLLSNPEWRRNLPASLEAGPEGGLPPRVGQFFAERFAELRALLDRLEPSEPSLTAAWRDALEGQHRTKAHPPAAPPAPPPVPAPSRAEAPPAAGYREAAGTVRTAAAPAVDYDGRLTCTICVSNLARAIEWYQSVLGFRAVYRVDALGWCELATATAGVSIGLSEVKKVEPGGITLNLGVTNLEAARKAMEAQGVRFDGPTQVIHNYVSLAPFFDPDGNRLVLAQEL